MGVGTGQEKTLLSLKGLKKSKELISSVKDYCDLKHNKRG